ncbi:MAG: four helix bundle protein [Planctomycetes bacterium]|nr:four helix bundle protein [Planctomycetota bacterium]
MSRCMRWMVWQKAREIVREVHRLAGTMERDAGLGTQMRRAAISVASNIAEGANRTTDADLKRFLGIARGSCGELQTQVTLAFDQGCLSEADHQRLDDLVDHVGRMLSRFIQRIEPP